MAIGYLPEQFLTVFCECNFYAIILVITRGEVYGNVEIVGIFGMD